jgi:cardiolipin synthase A/B
VNTLHPSRAFRGADVRDLRNVAQRAFTRAAGAPLVEGNAVRLLLDAAENYPAWLAAIRNAKSAILFENYIIRDDRTGAMFRDALAERARAGVKVRVLQDWLGSLGTGRKFWGPLLSAGGIVRIHNPARWDSPLAWMSRDHRKSIVIDGNIGFVSGLCVSDVWHGDPSRQIEPWRDTGVELRGPVCADLVRAFAQVWDENGRPLSAELAETPAAYPAGETAVRLLATAPNLAGVYRLDLLIASMASHRLWLTDAYFAGVPAYVQALRSAAQDGVDVRLLVPGGSDLPWLRPLSTAGYRPLLESGVRVFEWNGSMLHAKTAVADSRWARVGSTNLNIASWLNNWELDVAIEDEPFAAQMEAAYLRDIAHSTEVVLRRRKRIRLPCPTDTPPSKPGAGSITRAAAGAIRIGRTVGAAVLNHRILGPAEAKPLALSGLAAIAVAAIAFLWPAIFAWPLAFALGWFGTTILLRAWRLLRTAKKRSDENLRPKT